MSSGLISNFKNIQEQNYKKEKNKFFKDSKNRVDSITGLYKNKSDLYGSDLYGASSSYRMTPVDYSSIKKFDNYHYILNFQIVKIYQIVSIPIQRIFLTNIILHIEMNHIITIIITEN